MNAMRLSSLKHLLLVSWLPLSILFLLWLSLRNSESPYFPSLEHIGQSFITVWSGDFLTTAFLPSMGRVLAGMLIAVSAGVLLGLIIGANRTLLFALNPILDFFRSLPKPALLPPLIVLMGVGDGMKIFIIAFGAFWPVLLNMIDGVRSVDKVAKESMRVYGLRPIQQTVWVTLPAASPAAFVGIRVAFAIALVMMVVSEMVGSANGLGGFVLLAQQTFAIPSMWVGIITIGLVGYALSLILNAIERYLLGWYEGWKKIGEAN